MRRTIALLVLAGLALSGYLLSRHFALLGGAAGRSVCSTVLHLDCDEALASPASRFAGLPLAGWGIVWFGTLGTLLIVANAVGEPMLSAATRIGLAIALFGAAAGLALLAMMALGVSPFCPLCAAVHAIDFALVPLFARASGRPIRALGGEIREAFAFVRAPGPAARLALAGCFIVALAALVIAQSVYTLEVKHQPLPAEVQVKLAVANYALGPRLEFPADDRDPRFGAADAPTQIVVFSDFECPSCRAFAARLAKLVGNSHGTVSAVFKHFPADPACNRTVKQSHHPNACAAARAAEAARLQGKFAEVHDALFAETAALTDDVLLDVAKAAGLDLTRFAADRDAEAARRKVTDDIELGIRLHVQETPTVFLNGRKVPDIGPGAFGMIMMSQANDKPVSLTKTATPVADDASSPGNGEDPAQKPADDH